MNILFVYPKYPDTFWSFTHALRFISKKAAVPPLGLITVSAMLPSTWNKKLVDMNITHLNEVDIMWADYVFISAMYVQKESVNYVISECQNKKVKIVAGGPLFTQEFNNYPQIDHFILNEAEITLPLFLQALEKGKQPERVYQTSQFADLRQTPVPDYQLLSMKDYANMNLQIGRGCPFACDFCEITSLLGHKVRMKDTTQVIEELEMLFKLHWRGPISIVDDNFIGNKKAIKEDLIPSMYAWMEKHKFPFTFATQSSINLADDEQLMEMMTKTGFTSTFIGIETPAEKSLHECNKVQNENRDMLQSIKKIQKAGMQVSGGFIVGFDSDLPSVFQRQIEFIQKSGIVSAMVGLLNAPKNTKLYRRLMLENRLTEESSGNNTDSSMNFIPKMSYPDLLDGYQSIIRNIYEAKPYYKRVRQLLRTYRRQNHLPMKINLSYLGAFFKSVFIIGMIRKGRLEYWKLIAWTLFVRPTMIVDAVTYTVYGYHFRTVYGLR